LVGGWACAAALGQGLGLAWQGWVFAHTSAAGPDVHCSMCSRCGICGKDSHAAPMGQFRKSQMFLLCCVGGVPLQDIEVSRH
jgi:hypothetical protein